MQLTRENSDRLVLSAVGTVLGLAFWLVTAKAKDSPLAAAALTGLLAAGTIAQLAWTGRNLARLLPWAVAVGLALALPALWVYGQLPPGAQARAGDEFRATTFPLAAWIALYVAIPFVQIVQETGRARFSYGDLFRHAWNNLFVVGIGWVVVGLAWALLGLWSQLFALVGVDAFERLFFSRPLADVVTLGALGFGLALGRESERVVSTLRRVTLTIFRALMPLLAFIALLFLASLPFTGLAPLWSTRAASPVLLSVLTVAITFLNGVFQDGTAPPPYPRWLRRGVEAMVLALPVFAALSLYSIGLRIAQHGLMPERVYVVVFGLVGAAFGLGYGGAVLWRRGVWMGLARAVNVATSLVVAALALLLHTPLLDPLVLSARSQYARLASGTVDAASFDYGALQFKLGQVGRARLADLARLEGHREAAVIRAEVERVRDAASYWAFERRLTADRGLEAVVPGATVPEGLVAAVRAVTWPAIACTSEPCPVFAVNLDDDPDAEYVVLPPGRSDLEVFDRAGDRWAHVGSLLREPAGGPAGPPLLELVRQGRATAAPPAYRDLVVGPYRFHLGVR